MPTVGTICERLREFAPADLAESWDNTGLLLGRTGAEVRGVMTCLTLTEAVAREAVALGVQLIVTHHPLFFRPVRGITESTPEGRAVLLLAEHGVAVYSPHTSFDSALEGINQGLAESLGLSEIVPLRPSARDIRVGGGRMGIFAGGMARSEFLARVAAVTGAGWLEYCAAGPELILRVGIGCGAGGEFLRDAMHAGCDTFITGESRFHGILEAESAGMNLVLSGHYASERPAVELLARRLSGWFEGLECVASAVDRNPICLWSSGRLT
jgi:dinuclear metal center YbgI/SA1388 family protein